MKKKILSGILVGISIISCTKNSSENLSVSNKTELSTAIVVDGPINDESFNQSAWEGIRKSELNLGYKIAYKQTIQPSEVDAAFENLLQEQYSILIGIGYKIENSIFKQAKLNTSKKYVIVDSIGFSEIPQNLLPIDFKTEQSSFLAGYIAAKMTKTGKIGFIGGIKGNIIDKFNYGFLTGAFYANPDVEVASMFVESFADVAKGKSIADLLYQRNFDILYHGAGASGIGVIEAAKEQRGKGKNVWVIGADRDQSSLAPGAVLCSTLKNTGAVLYDILYDWKEGKWNGGKVVGYGLSKGGVGLKLEEKFLKDSLLKEIESVKEKILTEEIKVPFDEGGFESFRKQYNKSS